MVDTFATCFLSWPKNRAELQSEICLLRLNYEFYVIVAKDLYSLKIFVALVKLLYFSNNIVKIIKWYGHINYCIVHMILRFK